MSKLSKSKFFSCTHILLFIIVVEGLSRSILEAKRKRYIEGILIGGNEPLTHLLFVGDVIVFTTVMSAPPLL